MESAARIPAGPVEVVIRRLQDLMLVREELRSRGAAPDALERNRREIVDAQWELSHALIERHLPPHAEAA